MNKKILIFGTAILLLIGLPAVIFLSQKPQDTRSRASASTTLYLAPESTTSSPVTTTKGETVSFDVMVRPGDIPVSYVQLKINYDTSLLQPAPDSFTINKDSSFNILDGPVNSDGIALTLATGGDLAKAVTTITKIGTIKLIALGPTQNSPIPITFGDATKILTISPSANHDENILSTAIPAYLTINDAQQDTSSTRLSINAFLHGIGAGGDNANSRTPNINQLGPKRPTRSVQITIYDTQNRLVNTTTDTLTYNTQSGSFTGIVEIKDSFSTGVYTVKIKSAGYLTRLIPGSHTITSGQIVNLPQASLVAGDINGDNTLNTIDYNLLQACYGTKTTPSCSNENKLLSDLNDDGAVDVIDLNIYLREFSTKSGD